MLKYNGKPVADFIYLPERAFDTEKFLNDVKEKFEEQNQVYIVVSEGLRTEDGNFYLKLTVYHQDTFGHAQLGGVCEYLRSLIIKCWNYKKS